MSLPGRPKGEYTAMRSMEVAMMSLPGRPKGEYTAMRSMELA